MGGGGGGGDTEQTIRYADYIEDKHKAFLDEIVTRRTAAIGNSPYASSVDIACDDGFFGVGYTLASFPSLYDMYGKFMAGLDVDALGGQIFGAIEQSAIVDTLMQNEAIFLTDDLVTNILPRYDLGSRNINSIMGSPFVIGRALLEESRLKALAKTDGEMRFKALPLALEAWRTHLDWNKSVMMTYSEIMRLYFSAKMDVDNHNKEIVAKDRLWPFTVLDYERVAIAALQGATKSTTNAAGSSGVGRALSGALGGAAMGAMTMPTMPVMGAAIGGILGLAGAL